MRSFIVVARRKNRQRGRPYFYFEKLGTGAAPDGEIATSMEGILVGAENNPDFVLKRTMTGDEAVRLLKSRFPMIDHMVGSENEPGQPFYAYERLAEAARAQLQDGKFIRRLGDFINELAASDDSLLQEVLIVSLLENIAGYPDVADALRPHLNSNASGLLKQIEQAVYGR